MDAGNRIQFTPLNGAHSETPLSYLLEIDDFKILLDCGWNDKLDLADIQPIVDRVPEIDAVLLSHSDTTHLGALPYLVGKKGLKAPVYATLPVHKMGQMYMYDHYLSRQAGEDQTAFDLDDVDAAFALITPLKYSQHVHLTASHGRSTSAAVTVTPYNAGHLLGGTLWKISKETEDVVYAVDFNHKKERHLNGTVLESFNRPSLLITDAFNAANRPPARAARDKELTDTVAKVLRGGGSVLIPIDTAGRVLELVLHLEQYWTVAKLASYKLVLLTNVAYNTMEFAKSHIEWMNDAISTTFDQTRTNAFKTRHLHLCHSVEELAGLGPGPKLVMASMQSLEVGPARELFVTWATNPRNLLLFPDMGQPNTLAREVMRCTAAAPQAPDAQRLHRQAHQAAPHAAPTLAVAMRQRVALVGEELARHNEVQAAEAAEAAAVR
eukprot:CAMPEP_0118929284 /NCGR_PEP_ID=MMETSP1169-20130426/6328_1 /TAXON_ID=36882 /ORGANISM="Pyramimonas obovata, Strain CCMP722" /LENGTH=437 /DNA_ID=CAMNT_0006871443 /DNA_START=155 /DNA_END=1465 /DNA_ORIENTATION=+